MLSYAPLHKTASASNQAGLKSKASAASKQDPKELLFNKAWLQSVFGHPDTTLEDEALNPPDLCYAQ